MPRSLRQALAVAGLLAFSSSWLLGWTVAVHVVEDHRHGEAPDDHAGVGLELALHGHAHSDATPAHGHPYVGSVATPLPGKLLLLAPAMPAASRASVLAQPPDRRWLSPADPTHDPPPRPETVSVLRI